MEKLIEEFFNNPEQFAAEIVQKLREEIESGKEGRTTAEDMVYKIEKFIGKLLYQLSLQTQEALKESIGYVPEDVQNFSLAQLSASGAFLRYALLDVNLLSALAVAKEKKYRPELLPLLQEFRSLNQERQQASSRSSESSSINLFFFLCWCPSKGKRQITLEDGTKIPLPDGREIIRKTIKDN